ncbi:MAG: MarP family serine protease [Candidatus Dormibacteria bacterium]
MDLVDLVIILALVYAGLWGYRRGLLYSVLSLVGLLVGLAVGVLLAVSIPGRLTGLNAGVRSVLGAALLLAMAFLGDFAGTWAGIHLRRRAGRVHLGAADSALGLVWGLLATLLASWYLGLTFGSGPWQPLASQIQGSTILHRLAQVLPEDPIGLGDLQRVLSGVPFPAVFANLVPPLPSRVALPGDLGGNRAVQAAAAETVKVEGSGCGGLVEGSGFPVAPNLILTNAHVVAGTGDTTVSVPGRFGADSAAVVLFDPQRDLALLRVPGLNLNPLPISSAAGRGTQGAVIGYPGGGSEQVVPGAIRGQLDAVGRDIYGTATVTREIYVLQAQVIPGNSGGPFVNLHGQVVGVVFAKSLVTSDEGYALTTNEVEPDLSADSTRTRPVSTQSCAG